MYREKVDMEHRKTQSRCSDDRPPVPHLCWAACIVRLVLYCALVALSRAFAPFAMRPSVCCNIEDSQVHTRSPAATGPRCRSGGETFVCVCVCSRCYEPRADLQQTVL